MRMSRIASTALVLLGLGGLSAAVAETNFTDAKRLVVDVVWLKGGGELRGSILNVKDGQPTLMAVRREWLRKGNPKRLEMEEEREAGQAREVDEELLKRLDEWIAKREEDRNLKAVLTLQRKRCQERLAGEGKAGEPPEFVLVELTPEEIRRVLAQPADRRRLATVAWELRQPDVEMSVGTKLEPAVAAKIKDWRTHEADLSERLPALKQSDEEWSVRVALWEYMFRQPCDFQGTDAFVVRSDSGVERADVAALIAPALESTLTSQLGELLDPGGSKPKPAPDRWRAAAIAATEKAKLGACRVTRVNVDPAASRGSVASDLLIQMPGGEWETLWKDESAVDVAAVREEDVEKIRNDPQVKAVAGALEGLAGGQLDQALRFGAAVQGAQMQVDGRFSAFRERYSRRLTGPPLRWSKPENPQSVP
jgi:hypothetical protein